MWNIVPYRALLDATAQAASGNRVERHEAATYIVYSALIGHAMPYISTHMINNIKNEDIPKKLKKMRIIHLVCDIHLVSGTSNTYMPFMSTTTCTNKQRRRAGM